MQIGIPIGTFWHLNPLTLEAHFNAYKKNKEYEFSLIDSQAWLAGSYIQHAVASVLDPKGKTKYPSEAYGVQARLTEEQKLERFIADMQMWQTQHNSRFKKMNK